MLRNRVSLPLLLAAFAAAGYSQDIITGKVLDPSGAAVARATVRLVSRDSAVSLTTQTGNDGAFAAAPLPPGEYLAGASAPGFDPSEPLAVRLPAAALTLRLNFARVATRIQVTAESSAQLAFETAKAVDVLERADFERRAEFSLVEALRPVPGLRVQQLGGPGSFTRILSRGLRAVDTSLLVDGMRLRDAAAVQGDATAFLGDLLTANTERVEVLRGSGSSLYGTHATGSAINLVTDSGGGRPRGTLSAEGGGLGLFRGTASAAGGLRGDRLQYSAGLTHLNVGGGVDGNETVRNTLGQGWLQARLHQRSTLTGRLLGFTSGVGLTANPYTAPAANLPAGGFIRAVAPSRDQIALADQGRPFAWGAATFMPNLRDPDSRRVASFVSPLFAWSQRLSPRAGLQVRYQSLVSNRENRNGPGGSGYQPLFNSLTGFRGRVDTVQARTDISLSPRQQFSAGYEWEREDYRSPSQDENPDPAARVNAHAAGGQRSHSAFAQHQARLAGERLQVALSGRWQGFDLRAPRFSGGAAPYQGVRLETPPRALTGDAALAWFVPSAGLKLRAHAGNSYRAPSLYERYGASFFFGSFGPLGDPQLRPERAVSFDAGFDQYLASNRLVVSGSYFYTRLQEVIGYASLRNDPYGRWGGYVNTGGGLARGVELSAEARPTSALRVNASYTFTNADERRSALAGGTLRSIRVFPHAVSTQVTQSIGRRLELTADWFSASEYVAGTFFVGSENRPYLFPGPRKLDAVATYTLPLGETRSLALFTRIENLANQRYYEDGFRTPRAWATLGLRLAF
jgi:iron complex outermembrane receptor protein